MYANFDDFDRYEFPEGVKLAGSLLGNNQKSILVLTLESKLENDNTELLKKILSAKNIDLNEDTLLLSLVQNQQVNISRIIREKEIKHLLFFGIQPKQVGINIQWNLYQKINFGALQILVSHSLDDLSTNQSNKRSLWQQLKSWEF